MTQRPTRNGQWWFPFSAKSGNRFWPMTGMMTDLTVESLMSWQSRDPISTVLCHSKLLESPNEQGGATVGSKSRDCQDMKGSAALGFFYRALLKDCHSFYFNVYVRFFNTVFHHSFRRVFFSMEEIKWGNSIYLPHSARNFEVQPRTLSLIEKDFKKSQKILRRIPNFKKFQKNFWIFKKSKKILKKIPKSKIHR